MQSARLPPGERPAQRGQLQRSASAGTSLTPAPVLSAEAAAFYDVRGGATRERRSASAGLHPLNRPHFTTESLQRGIHKKGALPQLGESRSLPAA
ncbi:hypothetical protein SKAU_G00310110 [Synaphobranchus kaupii]|uniref:Uncharacterized protein n=1 Tax=Synaphobranchus kaupii TaxID=118154 RepID=A0A9Q1ERL3_SYNKA|nr:hypothetical protein SKAU_G00310110 [Synaphobranchus kaupii]